MIARLTIYQRIVALTAAAILLSLGAMTIVTFRGPPPVARPLGIDDLAQWIVTGRGPPDWRFERSRTAPVPPAPDLTDHPAMAAEVAARAHLSPGSVRLLAHSGPMPHRDRMLRDPFTLAIRQGKGWLLVHAEPRPAILRWYAVTLGLMAGVFVLLMLPVRRVARTIGDPIARLACAAEGQGADPQDFAAEAGDGPPEVRALVAATNAMRQRIHAQDRDRAALLRAIAHDLRTPMTRLSFRVDRLPEEQRTRAQADIAEMQAMIVAILDFMDGHRDARLALVDAVSLIEALVEGYREQGAAVAMEAEPRLVVLADAALLRRAVQNVLDNAMRYAGSANLRLATDGREARVTIEDEGPGIPAADLARATEPFWRGETSRARSTGGAGLGLAIVREAMAAMGGSVTLERRSPRGLRVVLRLPLAD